MIAFLLFLLATAAGSLATLYWIPEADLGRGYFQMNALVVLGLLGLALAVALRLLVLGATLAAAGTVDPRVEPNPLRLLTGLSGQGIFFWFRLLWGLAVPLVLAAMALHCARQRSNQSATGILYVVVVGTFIGEITGYFLTVTTGVPV